MTSVSLALDSSAQRARAFAAARRHSASVRIARRAIPLIAVVGVAAFVALGAWRNFERTLRDVSFEGIGIEGGRITMEKPHLSGQRPGGGGYDITASKAMQDAKHPGAVDLASIAGDVTTPDGQVSRLSAETGHYESADETMDLSGEVRLSNARYEVRLKSVHIEFKRGGYVSKEPVTVAILPDTTIEADAFEAKEGGGEVHFEGHVRTLINAGAAP